jgi:hypothetical protein
MFRASPSRRRGGRKLRILHGPSNVAGMAGLVAAAQRRLGHDAISVSMASGRFGYETDWVLGGDGAGPGRTIRARELIAHAAFDFDVFHFYYDATLFGQSMAEIAPLKALGRGLVFTVLGCDVRDPIANAALPLTACTECAPRGCSPVREKLLDVSRRHGDLTYATTPDLIAFAPHATWLPLAFDPAKLSHLPAPPTAGPLRVLHAPTDRGIKGSRHVLAAIDDLRGEGAAIELVLVEKQSQAELFAVAAGTHLVVDQIMAGVYGAFACEMMAAGRPVIAHLRPDLLSAYPPGCPIIDATPATLKATLAACLAERGRLAEIAARSRAFALTHHTADAVATRIDADYRALGWID